MMCPEEKSESEIENREAPEDIQRLLGNVFLGFRIVNRLIGFASYLTGILGADAADRSQCPVALLEGKGGTGLAHDINFLIRETEGEGFIGE